MDAIKVNPAHIFTSCGFNVQAFKLAPGEGTVMHDHLYPHDLMIVEGEVKVSIGDALIKTFSAGDTVRFPTGALHNFAAVTPALVLSVCLEKDLLL